MKVFISYSGKDLDLVEHLADALDEIVDVDYWDASRHLGEPDWDQIFEWIEESDLVLVLITDRTVQRAMAVGNEVGHAKAHGKAIFPLVAEGVPSSDLGCLGGITYERFQRDRFAEAVDRVVDAVDDFRRDRNTKNLIGAGLLAGLGYLAWKNNKNPPGDGQSGRYL